MEEVIKLECESCGCRYEKPSIFVEHLTTKHNVFFKWSLTFCDNCRREKELQALNALPDVLRVLQEKLENSA